MVMTSRQEIQLIKQLDNFQKDKITHESGRVVGIGADFSVNLYEPLHDNLGNVSIVQGILETVTEENNQGQWFPKFVRARAGSGGENTTQFVQHPWLRGG